jgi:hypothetical protein
MYPPYTILSSPTHPLDSLARAPYRFTSNHSDFDMILVRVFPHTPRSLYGSLPLPAATPTVLVPSSYWTHQQPPHVMSPFPILVAMHPQQVQLQLQPHAQPQPQPQQPSAHDIQHWLQLRAIQDQQKKQHVRRYHQYHAAGDEGEDADGIGSGDNKRRRVLTRASRRSTSTPTTGTLFTPDTASPSHTLPIATAPASPPPSTATVDASLPAPAVAATAPQRHDCPVGNLEDGTARGMIKWHQLLRAVGGGQPK